MNLKRLILLVGAISLGIAFTSMWILFILGSPEMALASSHTVCPSGPPACAFSSVQSAVDAAADGDVIKVAQGTYTGVSNRNGNNQLVYLDKSLTIRGGYTTTNWISPDPVAFPTTLDADGQGRVLYITGDISPTIAGLRITGGEADGLGSPIGIDAGGGVIILSATATLKDNQIFENAANSSHNGDGGGLYLYQSDAILEGNTIFSNTAQRQGGGVNLYGSAALLTNNTISANKAPGSGNGGVNIEFSPATLTGNLISGNWGNGVFIDRSPVMLFYNTIADNFRGIFLWESDNAMLIGNIISHNYGGGIWTNGDFVTLRGNYISENSADWWAGIDVSGKNLSLIGNTIFSNTSTHGGGGGVFHGDGEIIGNTIISNTAGGGGGGLTLMGDAAGTLIKVTIMGNIISGNKAQENGGGMSINNSDATLINNIIADNQAIEGSGLQFSSSSSRLLHNTIARNHGGHGSGVWLSDSSVILTDTIIVSQTLGIYVHFDSSASLDATLWGGGTSWDNQRDWGGAGSIFTGTVNLWGVPDFIDYQAGDYRIGPESAAIDQGIEAGVMTDVENQPRPYQAPDIGADEYWPPGALMHIYLPLVR